MDVTIFISEAELEQATSEAQKRLVMSDAMYALGKAWDALADDPMLSKIDVTITLKKS